MKKITKTENILKNHNTVQILVESRNDAHQVLSGFLKDAECQSLAQRQAPLNTFTLVFRLVYAATEQMSKAVVLNLPTAVTLMLW